MKRILLIVNPVAGKMKAKSTLVEVLAKLENDGEYVTVVLTTRRGHAKELAKTAKENGFDVVICFGGDGTLNETICGLVSPESRLPLGYIPAGSTNDFAQSIKLPSDPVKAADMISHGIGHDIDIGSFNNTRYFTYVAAFGIFTATSYSVSQPFKNVFGHLAYILGSIKEITKIRSYHVKIEMDDKTIEDDFIFGAVANSTSVAGVVKLREDLVDMSDGLFEIGLIKKPRSIIELNRIVSSLMNSDFSKGVVEFYKSSRITVTSDEALEWTLDGEYAKGGQTVHIENINKAVTLVK